MNRFIQQGLIKSRLVSHLGELNLFVKRTQLYQNKSSVLSNQTIQLNSVREFKTTNYNTNAYENKQEKSLTVWSNLKDLKRSPLPALTLGLAGLIPFVAAPAAIISSGIYSPLIAQAQLYYGATILSFLGGVRWGFTLPPECPVRPDWVNLIYSVTPPLIAWSALLFTEPYSSLTMMGGLVLAAYVDMSMFGYPSWFKGMRFILSLVAVLSLWTTLVCKKVMVISEDQAEIADSEKVSK